MGEISRMKEIKVLTEGYGMCPTQWDGFTTEDEEVYIRFRHNRLQIYISLEPNKPVLYIGEEIFLDTILDESIYGEDCGCLSDEGLLFHLKSNNFVKNTTEISSLFKPYEEIIG